MSAEVKSDNELIAEFMGATPCEIEVKSIGTMPGYECEEFKLTVDELEYHTSWDWLMPVVEKITNTNIMNQAWYDTKYALIDGDIKTVYTRVVDFIKWYNSQPK